MRKIIRLSLKFFLLGLVLLVIAGFIYEQVGEHRDETRFARIGQAVDIGGRTLNLNCSGQGGPVVVFEAAGGVGFAWNPIQLQIAEFTRACWYDRAGSGWSEAGPFPRTADAIASDLHALLQAAGVPPPYVLVGHSFGGLPVRVFAGKYPAEVAGMVLVDSAHPDQYGLEPISQKGMAHRMPRPVATLVASLLPTMRRIGLIRLLKGRGGPLLEASSGFSPEQAGYLRFLGTLPSSEPTRASEGMNLEDADAAQVRAAGNLGDRPLTVLTRGKPFEPIDPATAKEDAAFEEIWIHKLQPELAQLSSRGRHIIVKSSGHGIPWEAPDAVVSAVRDVVVEVRAANKK